MGSVVAIAVYCCRTNNPQMYCFYKNCNLLSHHLWGSGIWENLPGLFWFIVWLVVINCPPGLWSSEGSAKDLCWQWFTHSDWLLPSLLRVSTGCWCEASVAHHVGFSQRATQAMPTVFPQGKWSARERRRENEQKTESAGSLITWCWKWHTIPSALPGLSHKPALAQCGRGEHRVWIPEGRVMGPSWRLTATVVFVLCF